MSDLDRLCSTLVDSLEAGLDVRPANLLLLEEVAEEGSDAARMLDTTLDRMRPWLATKGDTTLTDKVRLPRSGGSAGEASAS